MKKTFSFVLGIILLVVLASVVSAQTGAIWTTTANCGEDPKNENPYAIGQVVYINGKNFNTGNYNWNITGQPGHASCDPNNVVASGNVNVVVNSTNPNGAFCFPAYTVASNDCGVYKATVDTNKQDSYHVDLSLPTVPEFGAIVAGLTILSALGVFFIVRKR